MLNNATIEMRVQSSTSRIDLSLSINDFLVVEEMLNSTVHPLDNDLEINLRQQLKHLADQVKASIK